MEGTQRGGDLNYQYTGQEYEDELDLHNFRARFYDSDLMRFYAVDPAMQTASPYLYCGNSPLMYVDEDGEWFTLALIAAKALWSGYQAYEASGGDWNVAGEYFIKGASRAYLSSIITTGISVATQSFLGAIAQAGDGINFAGHVVAGGVIGGISNASHGKDFGTGLIQGMGAGALIHSGGLLATKELPFAGLGGNLIYSAGISGLENLGHGKKIDYSYTTYLGPLSLTYENGKKPQYGLSSMLSLYGIADNISKGHFLNWKQSLYSGTFVFEGKRNTGRELGYTWGNTIFVDDINAVPDYGRNFNNSIIGHERIHVMQHRMYRGITKIGPKWYRFSSDLYNFLYGDLSKAYGYLSNPFEKQAFHFRF